MVNIARFYSETWAIEKPGKPVTRQSNQDIRTHIRGWDIGVEVEIFRNEAGDDEIVVRLTGGSNKPMPQEVVFSDKNDKQLGEHIRPFEEIRFKVPRLNIVLNQDN